MCLSTLSILIDLAVVKSLCQKEKNLLPSAAKNLPFSSWLESDVGVINVGGRCCYFYWTFGTILQEDTIMVFGNNLLNDSEGDGFPLRLAVLS